MTPKHSPDYRSVDPKISQLEARLNRLYKAVKVLQQQVNQQSHPPQPEKINVSTGLKLRYLGLGFLFGMGLVTAGYWLISTSLLPSKWSHINQLLATVIRRDNSALNPVSTSSQGTLKPSILPAATWEYNVKTLPNLNYNLDLQTIINLIIEQAEAEGLPTTNLSLHLIDVKTQSFAEYRSQIPRFPASITKLFWMVALYDRVNQGKIDPETINYTPECQTDICQLIKKSNNESASRILDQITETSSVAEEQTESFNNWLKKRNSINQFFQTAGYKDINISQKNFPIPYINMENPEHWDKKMRGDNTDPIRNLITAAQTGRLMYEIVTEQAISKLASQQMLTLLEQDLNPQVWLQEESNPIAGFLGESLVNTDVRFASKVGWTSSTRFEVAAVISPDKNVSYILTVFGHGTPYARNEQIFPKISRIVYENMTAQDN
ncbi:MAG: serine hydrolase [Microcoleaceae cyanobacterium]